MLHLDRSTGQIADRQFREFPDLLRSGDLVVFNNTRVFPARLYGRRAGIQAQTVSARNPAARKFLPGRVEVLLTKQISQDPNEWECLVRPGRKIGVGERIILGEGGLGKAGELEAEVTARGDYGARRLRFAPSQDFFATVEKIGHIPLPPYISRDDSPADRERYQTVYAQERGSVAAPTAGLHFSTEILARLRKRGIETAEITLHVGLGTFQPVRVERVEEHKIHSERYSISVDAAEKLNRALTDSRRVIAIGTTTVRTLEYAATQCGGEFRGKYGGEFGMKFGASSGESNLFIYPGYKFQVVSGLLTNFHLPESTLLMLVCALGGQELVLQAYQHAVAQRYRFYSYGDCMFVE